MVLLCVDLFVLLEVLRPLEWLAADLAYVRLERCVHYVQGVSKAQVYE